MGNETKKNKNHLKTQKNFKSAMAKKMKIVILTVPQTGKCEYCGNVDALRPYGKNGENICFDCGMKPEHREVTEKNVQRMLNGEIRI